MIDDSCGRTVPEICDYVCLSTVCKAALACLPPVRVYEYGRTEVDLVVASTMLKSLDMPFLASIEV